jgi:Capsular polysaccharide synthesis protein
VGKEKKSSQTPQERSNNIIIMVELISSTFSSSLLSDYRVIIVAAALFFYGYHKEIIYTVQTLYSAVSFMVKRRNVSGVTSGTIEPWAEPSQTLDHNIVGGGNKGNNNQKKIIWGFWDGGEAKLPGFCQLAVESWRCRHPDWTIIILSDDNFRSYVSPNEVPSTFYSLKAQYRSDVVRLAVLCRYGGIYLDASYILFRSLDDIWDEAVRHNNLYLTSLVTLRNEFHLPNNCLLVAPLPQNPLLVTWQKLLLEYLERPLTTTYVADAVRHPSMHRVQKQLNDNDLGGYKNIVGYFGVLWTLADVLYYEPSVREYVQNHVYALPSYRWTFDLTISSIVDLSDKEVLTAFNHDESIVAWLKRLPTGFRFNHRYEPELAQRLLSMVCAMKISSDFCRDLAQPFEFHISRGSTLSLIYQAAIDTKIFPIKQADLVGARLFIPRTSNNNDGTSH